MLKGDAGKGIVNDNPILAPNEADDDIPGQPAIAAADDNPVRYRMKVHA